MQAALAQLPAVLMDEMDAAARASAFMVTRTAQKNYLSGPRPSRLGVVTNRLRGSLSEGDPNFIFDVQRQQARVTVTAGTNVSYAITHEPPGGRPETIIKPKKGKYLAVPSSFATTAAGALKDKYNRPLRQVANTFVRSIKAPKAEAAVFERIGKRIIPIAWLVKSVTIKARPFLAPALRDSTQWITERFQQGLRRVEKRINALSRGR
jgi:hypothetical protein